MTLTMLFLAWRGHRGALGYVIPSEPFLHTRQSACHFV